MPVVAARIGGLIEACLGIGELVDINPLFFDSMSAKSCQA
jgi:hypothetical protein